MGVGLGRGFAAALMMIELRPSAERTGGAVAR
jgi:hypothetical protein